MIRRALHWPFLHWPFLQWPFLQWPFLHRPFLQLSLLLGAILLASCPASVSAQEPSATVTMSVDRPQVEVGGVLSLRVEARVAGSTRSQLVLPDLRPSFDVVSRRVSRPFTFRFGMGSQQHVESTEVHVLSLRARQPGTHRIEPAVVRVEGREFESQALTIEVGGGGPSAGATTPADPGTPSTGTFDPGIPGPSQTLPPADSAEGMAYDPEAFIRTWVDRARPYVGQQVTVTVYLYTRAPLRGSPAITREPTTDGFWTRDLLAPSRTLRPEPQRIGQQTFNAYVLRRFAAFPLQAGALEVGPTTVTVRENGGFFGLFGGRGPDSWTRTGVPVQFDVRELPDRGRPQGDVHVGSLELDATLDRAEARTGDAVTLTVTARGRGAIEQVQIPSPRADGLRILQPEVSTDISTPNDVVGGTRTYRWLIVPERPGAYTLGPFEVPVFDPRAESYSVARSRALTLEAEGPATQEPDRAGSEPPPSDGAAAEADGAPDLRPIHTRSELRRSHEPLADRGWFLGLLLIGPLGLLGALGVRTARRRAERPDPSRAPKRARRAARRQLQAAAEHAEAKRPREFYAAVARAIKEVLEAKIGRSVGSFTHADLRQLLPERGMDDGLSNELVDELEGCEFARFSAAGVEPDEMRRCLDRARELLERLERFTPTSEEEA